MSIVEIVDKIREIVGQALDEAREGALGRGPDPDAEKTTYRIFEELSQAVRSDSVLKKELLAAMGATSVLEGVDGTA